MATSVELVLSSNLRNGIDSGHLWEIQPPSQLSITFLEFHDAAWSLVVARQVEARLVLRIIVQEHGVLLAVVVSSLSNSEVIKGETPVHDRISCICTEISHTHHLNGAIFEERPVNILFLVEVVYFVVENSCLRLVDWHDYVTSRIPEDWDEVQNGAIIGFYLHV